MPRLQYTPLCCSGRPRCWRHCEYCSSQTVAVAAVPSRCQRLAPTVLRRWPVLMVPASRRGTRPVTSSLLHWVSVGCLGHRRCCPAEHPFEAFSWRPWWLWRSEMEETVCHVCGAMSRPHKQWGGLSLGWRWYLRTSSFSVVLLPSVLCSWPCCQDTPGPHALHPTRPLPGLGMPAEGQPQGPGCSYR